MEDGDIISCQQTIRESQLAAISLQASSKARSDEAVSGASVTNSAVTFAKRYKRYKRYTF